MILFNNISIFFNKNLICYIMINSIIILLFKLYILEIFKINQYIIFFQKCHHLSLSRKINRKQIQIIMVICQMIMI
jgi:hypothetical protein